MENRWTVDELYLQVKGNKKYLYTLMDDETLFWIAQRVANIQNTADVIPFISKGREVVDTRPNTLISDCVHNIHIKYLKEF